MSQYFGTMQSINPNFTVITSTLTCLFFGFFFSHFHSQCHFSMKNAAKNLVTQIQQITLNGSFFDLDFEFLFHDINHSTLIYHSNWTTFDFTLRNQRNGQTLNGQRQQENDEQWATKQYFKFDIACAAGVSVQTDGV